MLMVQFRKESIYYWSMCGDGIALEGVGRVWEWDFMWSPRRCCGLSWSAWFWAQRTQPMYVRHHSFLINYSSVFMFTILIPSLISMTATILAMEEVSGGSSSLHFGCKSLGCTTWILSSYAGNLPVHSGMKCSNRKFRLAL